MDILEDKSGKMTIDEVISPRLSGKFKPSVRSKGYAKGFYWIRFTIENNAAAKQRWLLELDNPHSGYLDLYVPDEKGGFELMQAGTMRPMSIRAFQHRNPVFPVIIDGPGKTFYLRGDGNKSALLSLTVWSPAAFSHMDHQRDLVNGCYFGAMMVMFAYNLFLFLSLRDRTYLYYILDIFCFALYMFVIKGFLVEFVSGDMPSLNRYAFKLHVPVILTGLLFCRSFLNTARNAPFIDRIIKIFVFIAALSIPAIFVVPQDIWKPVMALVAASASILILTAGLTCLAKGYRPAAYFVGARVFRVFGVITFVLVAFNILPMNLLTMSGLQIGSILDVLLLSFALADRITVMRREKEMVLVERNRLAHQVVHISEDERRRISHELHDGLCQQLTAARLRFSVLMRKFLASGGKQLELTQLSALLDESVNHAHDLSRGLWPVELGPVGTIPSLEELARRLSEASGIHIEFKQNRRCVNCTNRHIIQLYRIAQEAITNAVKHAKTEIIKVDFNCLGTGIVVSVSDNGIGRSAAASSSGGLGVGIMHHRARIIGGDLRIMDTEGGGTSVVCNIPCDVMTKKEQCNEEY
jgi:signal transduction histidine kinase